MQYQCPICKKKLVQKEKSYVCENRHSFDVAKQGYVNLLQSQSARQHGDEKAMVIARNAFFKEGYYSSFKEMLGSCIKDYGPATVLDAGCGEGWYMEVLPSEIKSYGLDISKQAIIEASKRKMGAELAVGSTFDLPYQDKSFDLVYSIFAPFESKEIYRVLKDGGIFIQVYPLENHLFGMKEVLYPEPYLNPESICEYEGFINIEVRKVIETISLRTQEDIHNLFTMTPYYHRTPQAGKEKLAALDSLDTAIGFGFAIYQKQSIE